MLIVPQYSMDKALTGDRHSLVPRPSLVGFFAVVEEHLFFYGCEKSCEWVRG